MAQIDVDAAEIGRNLSAEVGIVADAKTAAVQLLSRLRGSSSAKPSRAERIAEPALRLL